MHLVFSSTIDDTAFTTTSFTIWSEKLTLSDDSDKHKDASITFGTEEEPLSGSFGNSGNGSISFTVNADDSSKKITGITEYTTKETGQDGQTEYDADEHAICLDFPAVES